MAQITYRLQATKRSQALTTAQPQTDAQLDVKPVVIRLLPLGAAPGLGSPAMLYSPQPGQLMPYRDSRWLAPPAELIRAAIAQTLSRQPWVSAVEQGTPLAPATWTLHCDLTRLEQDLQGSQGVVRMDLRCQLVQTDTHRLAAHWQVDGAQPIDVNDAAHYAAATQTLLNAALQAVVEKVGRAVLQPKAQAPNLKP
jgi:cholesterol transport system auxiliary component